MYQAPVSSSKKSEQETSKIFLLQCRVLPSVFRTEFTSALPFITRCHAMCSCTHLLLFVQQFTESKFWFTHTRAHTALVELLKTPLYAVILNRVIPIQHFDSCRVRNEEKAGLEGARLYLCIKTWRSKEKNCKQVKKTKDYYIIINQSLPLNEKLSLKYQACKEE